MTTSERTINFTRGVPADEAFPAPELADCVTAVLREPFRNSVKSRATRADDKDGPRALARPSPSSRSST